MSRVLAGAYYSGFESMAGGVWSPMVDVQVRQAVATGPASVLVEARLLPPPVPESELTRLEAVIAQREAIAAIQGDILACLPADHVSVVRCYETLPLLALVVDAKGLKALERLGDIVSRVLSDRTAVLAADA